MTQTRIEGTVEGILQKWRCPDNAQKFRLPAGALHEAVAILQSAAQKHGKFELLVTEPLILELVELLKQYPTDMTDEAITYLEVALGLPAD